MSTKQNLTAYVVYHKSQNSTAGKVTKLWTRQSGVQIPGGAGDFLISKMSRLALGPT